MVFVHFNYMFLSTLRLCEREPHAYESSTAWRGYENGWLHAILPLERKAREGLTPSSIRQKAYFTRSTVYSLHTKNNLYLC